MSFYTLCKILCRFLLRLIFISIILAIHGFTVSIHIKRKMLRTTMHFPIKLNLLSDQLYCRVQVHYSIRIYIFNLQNLQVWCLYVNMIFTQVFSWLKINVNLLYSSSCFSTYLYMYKVLYSVLISLKRCAYTDLYLIGANCNVSQSA